MWVIFRSFIKTQKTILFTELDAIVVTMNYHKHREINGNIYTRVCHSDIHVGQEGDEGIGGEFLKTTDRGVKYPLTPGHEIAGTIESMGDEAEGFSKNQKVIVFPWIGEGLCPACRVGQEN